MLRRHMACSTEVDTADKRWWERGREKFANASLFKGAGAFLSRGERLPAWSHADVQDFISSDPVYGPQLKLMRQGAKVSAVGALIGGLASASICYQYSHSVPGTFLGLVAGAGVGCFVAEEGANHAFGLYKFDTMDANLKFLEWWEKKVGK